MATMRRSVLLSFKILFCLVVVLCVYSAKAIRPMPLADVGSRPASTGYSAYSGYDYPYGVHCRWSRSVCAGGRGKCTDDPLQTCFVNNFIETSISKYVCRTINATRTVSERACVGVPKPVSNVRVIILPQGMNTETISMNITWDPPSQAVGPLLYQIGVRGYLDDPKIPRTIAVEYADENTFYKVIENQENGLMYNIYVTALTAAGASELDRPVQITNTKPDFQSDVLIMKPSHSVTSFGVRLCTSCLTDPKLGLVTAAAIIVCNADYRGYCPQDYVNQGQHFGYYGDDEIPNVHTSEDLDRFPTWAAAKKGYFYGPYRTTEDGFFDLIKTEKDSEFLYLIGSGNCNEDDQKKFCNGPVLPNSDFRISVILCNNVGCTETSSDIGTFTTKPAPRGVNYKAISIGLSVALAFTFMFSFALAVYAISLRRSASDPFKYEKASKAQRL